MYRSNQRHAVNANLEVVGRISPDRHEGPRPQRDLAAIADQQIHAQCSQCEDQERDEDGAEHVLVWNHRPANEGEGDDRDDEPFVLRDGEDLLVGRVGGFELAVFTIKHVVSP